MTFVAMLFATVALVGCGKKDSVLVSTQDLWFGTNANTKELQVTANCEWTVTQNDTASWYTISTMSGKNDGTITVTVQAMEDADYRSSTFVVTSPGGHIRRTVFVTQNKLEFDGLLNKVFGVMSVEYWNTDYYDQMIEDSYKHKVYDPYDTTTGYQMYFLADGQGVQRDHHKDTVVYYRFDYEYNPLDRILKIQFETVDEGHESYAPLVLTASDSLFRFIHEYKDHWWERADMRKVGIINPGEGMMLRQAATKRKADEPIFKFE